MTSDRDLLTNMKQDNCQKYNGVMKRSVSYNTRKDAHLEK